jgi:hypothetical protein
MRELLSLPDRFPQKDTLLDKELEFFRIDHGMPGLRPMNSRLIIATTHH